MSTPLTVQVTFDCAEPHALAAWWAALLEWTVEPQDADFIRTMVERGLATPEDTAEVDGHLVWRSGCAITAPPGLPAPRILFQSVPEPKSGKNRVHLDLRVGAGDPESARARAEALGAVVIGGGEQGPHRWVTYQDPEGNEFCL